MPSSGLLGKVRFVLWGIVAVAVIGAGVSMLGTLQQSVQDGRNAPAAIRIGGPFELTAHTGAAFSSQQLQGKPHLVFFGFTNCPDICPTTLVDISQLLDTLGNDADKLEALFITV
ncbi:MAG: SCO family protein, partial [Pseudomonadota bacterium]